MDNKAKEITIAQLPSGFWAVFVDGVVFYAAAGTKEQAEAIAEAVAKGNMCLM